MTRARPAPRRRSDEVRSLVLAAARELFSAGGYDSTTTKAISQQAGVSEALVFSNFGSKEDLFRAAVLAPFTDVIDRYIDDWHHLTRYGGTGDALLADFVRSFYDLARNHRALLLACLAHKGAGGSGPEIDLVDQFATALRAMQSVARNEGYLEGYRGIDAVATVASTMGTILGVALLDDLLFPPGTRRPAVDRLVSEVVQQILYGLKGRADPDARSRTGATDPHYRRSASSRTSGAGSSSSE